MLINILLRIDGYDFNVDFDCFSYDFSWIVHGLIVGKIYQKTAEATLFSFLKLIFVVFLYIQ